MIEKADPLGQSRVIRFHFLENLQWHPVCNTMA